MAKVKKLFLSLCLGLMMVFSIIGLTACGPTVNNFNLVFRVDNESYATISTNGSEMIAIPENPSKEGYTFEGWFWDNGTWEKPFTANSLLDAPISSDMSIYAKFDTIDYIITYETNGGTHNNPASYTVEDSFALSNAEKIGYTFDGWYNGENEVSSIAEGSKGDLTLTAQWTTINYTITYTNTKDVENDNIVSYTIESDTITLNPLVKAGYTFEGWYNGETEVSEIVKGSTGNIELAAKWTPIGYEITYHNVEGATNANPETYDVEDEPLALINAVKEGYTFIGWYTDAAYQNAIDEIVVGTIGDLDLYAKFDIINYNITYVYDQTKVTANENATTYTILDSTTFEDLTVIEHYRFEGWFADSSYQTAFTGIAAGTTGEKTVYGKITPVVYQISYKNTKGVANSNPTSYTIESEEIIFEALSKDGYTFDGWDIRNIATGSTGDVTVTASWNLNTYTITYANTKDAENSNPLTYTIESEDITFVSIDVDGYDFIGWDVNKIASGSFGNKIITATWTPTIYHITYENIKGAVNSNPTTYTIESEDILFVPINKNGYTFDGWDVKNIATGSTGDVTVTASWDTIKYKITYMYDTDIGDYADSNKNPDTYTIEDDFEFISLVNKTTGYTFDGWYTEKNIGTGTKITGIDLGTTGAIQIFAHWALDEYTITYHNADGVINTNAKMYTIETDTFDIFDVAKEGYTFGGWYTDNSFNTRITKVDKGSTGKLDLYAKWTPIEYTINYVLYGGTYSEGNSNPEIYTIETKHSLVAPKLSGYIFDGWYTSADFSNEIEKIDGNIGNLTLYVKWIHISTITFVTNGGNVVSNISAPAGTSLTLPTPSKNYYDFECWCEDSGLTRDFVDEVMPDDDITLYAKYTPTKYNITYVLNGGDNAANAVYQYTYEDAVSLLPATKTGYTFVGWFADAQFTSNVVDGFENRYGNLTFYANFSINKYTISFNSNGGTDVEPITQNYNTKVDAPSIPAKKGYKFVAWYIDEGLRNVYTFDSMPAKDITLYAKWKLENYSIIYNLSSGINNNNNPSTFTIESADITLQAPSNEGYNFMGWYSDSEYSNAITTIEKGTYNNIEVFAKWELVTYKITYVIDENAVNSNLTEYSIETDITYLADAILKGYTFDGWYKELSYSNRIYQIGGSEIGDIIIYGKFTANSYTVWLDGTEDASFEVSFDLNGASGSIDAQTITEANTLVYPTIPTREGYVFGGWYSNKECSGKLYDFTELISFDITLYAKWIKAEKSIAMNNSVSVNLVGKEEQKFMFVPLVSGNITLTTNGTYDTFGVLYDEMGNILKQDDDTGADEINFQIVYNVTAGKVYYISVRSFSSATQGLTTLYLSGDNNVKSGGYVIAGNKSTITYGTNFNLPVPTGRDDYKFLGWADSDGVLYTDTFGNSTRAWDKDVETVLVSKWERTVYTVTFVTNGGSSVESITLEYGDRLDLNSYVTTRQNYSFAGWYLSASDSEAYNATTMPDENLTLYAKWKTFALGSIKYDTDKLAISVKDTISAELFDAICIDTNGGLATFTVTVDGEQTVGETISVRLVATNGNKTKQVTITGIKVYGDPTLTHTETKEYFNIKDGLSAAWAGASGVDTFGNATTIKVYVKDEYKAGDYVTVTIESIDPAGNSTFGYINNVKAYGLPQIAFNETKTTISVNDTLNAELFNASAKDSFGETVSVKVTRQSGTISAGNTVTIRLTATDVKGNVTTIDILCKVYGAPTISNATKTDIRVDDVVTAELLGVTATDTFDESLTITLSIKNGTQTAGTLMTITASVVDVAGNVTTKDFDLKVYGTPTITYNREGVNATEDATLDACTVTFNLNGGISNIANQIVTNEVGLTYPEIPLRSGYVFRGWYTTADCTTLFDFGANITKDITVYAGWYAITTSEYGNEIMNVVGDNNSSSDYYSISTQGTSSSNALYTYFAVLKDGTYKLYYKNGSSSSSYRTYISVYNATQQTTIKSNTYISSTSFSYVSFTAKAGDVIYVKNYRYNTNYSSYYTTFSMYLDGNVVPTAGGLKPSTGAQSILNAIAKDSFGNPLTVTATLKSGSLTVGTNVVYTLTATDHLGNTYSVDTTSIGVYDGKDIVLEYSAGMSDLIKITSKGEEFEAKSTDSFGNPCNITIEAAEGYTLAGGNTISLYIVATDKAGNKKYSELIAGIKVYDMPEIVCKRENTIDLDSDPAFFFQVKDSFGEELYFTTTVIGELAVGNYVNIKLVVSDDAGHYVEKIFTNYYVKGSDKVLIKFVHSDGAEELLLCNRDGKNFPTKELTGWRYVWTSKPNNEGTVYDGTFQIEDDYLVLYAEFIKIVSLTLNSGTYTGDTTVTAIYQDTYSFGVPKRSSYEFLGWYDSNSGGTKYVDASGNSVFDTIEEDFPSTLYARWAAIYKITYNLNGGTKPSYNYPSQYTQGRTYSLGTPTKTGYTFGGWYTNSSLTNQITSITSSTTGNLYLYAKWTANKYTITLSGVYGATISSTSYSVSYNSTYTLPVPTKSGYVFLGWKLSDATSTTTTITGTSYSAKCTMLVAKSTGASVSAYTYTTGKTYVAVWQEDCPGSVSAYGSLNGGTGRYLSCVIGKGSYKLTWTMDNLAKSYAYLGGVEIKSRTGSKTFKITEDDRVYTLSAGIFCCGDGSKASSGEATFTKTA